MDIKLSAEVFNEVVKILSTLPYAQVAHIMPHLAQSAKEAQESKEVKPELPKS